MIGQKAPPWRAKAYLNGEEVALSSEEYAGKWHVLYFYPLDFTFICPTEIVGFQQLSAAFADESVSLLGVSTDSYFSHLAWFRDRQTFPQEITHPVIADTAHTLSRAFGVLNENEGVAWRATVIVDDQSIVRAMAVNDLSAGRSPAEVLRTTQALMSGGLCRADWQKGDAFAA
jgi:peroxiredoxin (alkyl hydroperoxide reductase subunit C)